MKTKNWVLWLLIAAFLASVGFLFLANRQKVAALDSARESKQQADDLQAQLDQLKSSIAAERNAELSKLRADNLDLPRLRNQVTLLQATNLQLQAAKQKLTQQLQAILATAQDQQGQLQQLVTEKQQASAAVQAAVDVVAADARNTCINNLRMIEAAKQQWALENNKTAGAIPTAQDIAPYIKLDANGNIPGCPSGGTYTIGAVGESPSCSIHGTFQP
jgi:hypothetical protein